MLAGAFVGATLVVHTSIVCPLVVVLNLVVIVAAWSARAGKLNPQGTKRSRSHRVASCERIVEGSA
jgi:hypothetical protein